MFRYFLFSLLFVSPWYPLVLSAQEPIVVTGLVKGLNGEPVSQCTVQLRDSSSARMLAFALSRPDGSFRLQTGMMIPGKHYKIFVEHIQYERQIREIDVEEILSKPGPLNFQLMPRVKSMDEVLVKAESPAFRIRGDTLDFKASAYRTTEARKVEDLFRNIQGFEVGTDGKIRFQGKEVDRVLIEGEDLTESQYQLLTRNLHAGLIDRIQVLNNFDANRINATINRSEKVGINLTVDKQYAHKWSGNAEAGLGNESRRMAELNMIRLSARFKFIQFIQHNTISRTSNADMNFHYRDGEPPSARIQAEEAGLIHTGTIQPPALPDTYTKDNNDYSGFAIGSWKASPAVRLKLLAAMADTRLSYRSYANQVVTPPGENGWELNYLDEQGKRGKAGLFRTSLIHDKRKRNLGRYDIDLRFSQSADSYGNFTTGAILDSLRESMDTRIQSLYVHGEETFQVSRHQVLNLKANFRTDQPGQTFRSETDRYASFYGLQAQRGFYRQELSQAVYSWEVDGMISRRWAKGVYSYGARVWRTKIRSAGSTFLDSASIDLPGKLSQDSTDYHVLRTSLYGHGEWKSGKRVTWTAGAVLGCGMLRYAQLAQRSSDASLVYKSYIGFTYLVSSLKYLSVQLQSDRDIADPGNYHPSGLLSGQAAILNGAGDLPFPASYSFQASYLINNLHKGNLFMFALSGGINNRQWAPGIVTNPMYSLFYPVVTDGNKTAAGQINTEKFLRFMRTKLGLRFSALYSDIRMLFNQVYTRNSSGQFSFEPRLTTSLKGAINAEASVKLSYNLNRTIPQSGEGSFFSQWQYQGMAKVKFRVSAKIYSAVQIMGFRLAPRSTYTGCDLYLKWSLSSAWSLAVYGHNLLQSVRIEQRFFGPNSITSQGFILNARYGLIRVAFQF